jgi:hypothetical protein
MFGFGPDESQRDRARMQSPSANRLYATLASILGCGVLTATAVLYWFSGACLRSLDSNAFQPLSLRCKMGAEGQV